MIPKGISVIYAAIHYWCLKFGKLYAKRNKHIKLYDNHVYIDKVICKINIKSVYLWSVVDQDCHTIDVLVQEKERVMQSQNL